MSPKVTPQRLVAMFPGLISLSKLAKMRMRCYRGDGPNYIKLSSRKVLYDLADFEAWLNRFKVCPKGESSDAA